MGSYCSIHNDTRDETVMVYLGANTELIKPLLIAISGLATAASSGAAWGVIPRIVGTVTVGAADTTLVVSVGALTAAASGVVSAKHTHRTNGHWPSICVPGLCAYSRHLTQSSFGDRTHLSGRDQWMEATSITMLWIGSTSLNGEPRRFQLEYKCPVKHPLILMKNIRWCTEG